MAESVEVSVTHEMKIDGEKTWVGGRYTTEVQGNETFAEAFTRAGEAVDQAVLKQVSKTVAAVQQFTN